MKEVTHLHLVKENTVGARRKYGQGSLYKRGNLYWIAYRVHGKQKAESTGTGDKEAAEQLLLERLVEIGRGNERQFLGWQFRDTADEWFEHIKAPGGLAYSTLELWRGILDGHLLPLWGDEYLHQMVEPMMFERYVASKLAGKSTKTGQPLPTDGKASKKPLSQQTVNHHLTVLSMIFDWAMRDQRVSANPLRQVKRPKIIRDPPEPFEREEIQGIVGQLTKDEDKFLVLTLASLGLRLGEALGLKVSDYLPAKRLLRVRRTLKRGSKGSYYLEAVSNRKKGKTPAASRDLALGEHYAKLLDAHIKKMDKAGRLPKTGDQMVFPNKLGKLKYPGNWRRRSWDKAVEGAGLYSAEADAATDKPKPHRLRHTYASEKIAAGVPVSVIAYWMGHANPQVTLTVYAHIFKRHNQEIADSAELYAAGAADTGDELKPA